MPIWIQIVRKRCPHADNQIRKLQVGSAIAKRGDLLFCVAKYKGDLVKGQKNAQQEEGVEENTSEKWLTPIAVGVVLNLGASHL